MGVEWAESGRRVGGGGITNQGRFDSKTTEGWKKVMKGSNLKLVVELTEEYKKDMQPWNG